MSFDIHWQEGLFLQPHHLQRMQRRLAERAADDRKLGRAYPYGLIEARLSRDELENKRIRFERLRAIMPSGLEVDFPSGAELPSLDIAQAFAKGSGSFNVSLGVPLWQNARANTPGFSQQADSRVKLLYRVAEIECVDENSGENPRPLQVRKINARLMFEQEDPSEMEVLPLLRIVRAAGEDVGLPREEPEYVPPCLVLRASPTLRELARDLVAQVEASRKALVVQITRGGFTVETMRGAQFEQIMRLRTLNRFSARLPALVLTPNITPFEMYLEFRELLAELMALHPDRDDFECAEYDHDNLFLCFRELSTKIRPHLRGSVEKPWRKVAFEPEAQGVLTAKLGDDDLNLPNAYFLAVQTKLDPLMLARYVETPDDPRTPDKFKLMPRSMERLAVRGVALKEERHPPMELPAATNLHYFRLDRDANARMWAQARTDRALCVKWTGQELDFSDATFTLYMTVPAGTGK